MAHRWGSLPRPSDAQNQWHLVLHLMPILLGLNQIPVAVRGSRDAKERVRLPEALVEVFEFDEGHGWD